MEIFHHSKVQNTSLMTNGLETTLNSSNQERYPVLLVLTAVHPVPAVVHPVLAAALLVLEADFLNVILRRI